MQNIIVLDLEGVLIPEIWQLVAHQTGISKLLLTTRDIKDYDELMSLRLQLLNDHNLTIDNIREVISTLKPLDGAKEFLEELRANAEVIILSDTFLEFFDPIRPLLNYPTILCNKLTIDETTQKIISYSIRLQDGKTKAVKALQSIHCNVLAAGDSYNDLGMIQEADFGAFFCPPQSIVEEYPNIPKYSDYQPLLEAFRQHFV